MKWRAGLSAMARSRNIKPSLFRNEVLGVADPLLTLLFESLWCLADKEGRLEDRPLRIKADTFPYRDGIDVNRYLTELHRLEFIRRYTERGVAVIQVLAFKIHQSPHHTEKASVLPAFNEKTSIIHDCGPVTVISPIKDGELPAPLALIPDSLVLIPDSVGKTPSPFNEAWKLYPKRNGNNPRKDAEEAWNARVKAGVAPADMLAGLGRYAKWCEATGKIGSEHVMRASTFFGPSKIFEQDFALPVVKKSNGGAPWWSSNEGIQAKAAELGIEPRGGESWGDLKARINAAMGAA